MLQGYVGVFLEWSLSGLVVSPSFHQGRDNKDVTQQIGAMRINLWWDQMVHPLLAKFFVIPCRPRCIFFFCFDRWSVVEFQVFLDIPDIPFKVGERWDSQGKSQKWYQQRNQWLGLTPLRWDTWFLKGAIAQQNPMRSIYDNFLWAFDTGAPPFLKGRFKSCFFPSLNLI